MCNKSIQYYLKYQKSCCWKIESILPINSHIPNCCCGGGERGGGVGGGACCREVKCVIKQ